MSSGDKIRYFLEEEAVGKDGKLTRPKEKAVNKIGHGGCLLCDESCGRGLTVSSKASTNSTLPTAG